MPCKPSDQRFSNVFIFILFLFFLFCSFLRHWNRGEGSSCARTDLTFKPVPDSKLARRREERIRRQADRERDEREKEKERERAAAAHARKAATPDKRETPKPSTSGAGPIETITSPGFDRFGPRPYPDTPALRQLRSVLLIIFILILSPVTHFSFLFLSDFSEYARPHTGFSPGGMGPGRSGVPGGLGGLGPPAMDPMLHYQLASMYGGARERLELELEREKRERELRELREREISDRFKEEMLKNGAGGMAGLPGGPGGPLGPRGLSGPLEPHWLELHRRYGMPGGPPPGAGLGPPPGFGLYPPGAAGTSSLNPMERERLERMGLQLPGAGGPPGSGGNGVSGSGSGGGGSGSSGSNDPRSSAEAAAQQQAVREHQAAVDRIQAERIHAAMADQLRLQMTGQDMPPPGFPGYPGRPGPPPGLLSAAHGLPGAGMGGMGDGLTNLHPVAAAAMLGRPYDEQFARQFAAEQQLQRQMMEQQRFQQHPGAGGPGGGPPGGPPSLHPHPSIVAQHEEYLRYVHFQQIHFV